MPTHLGYEVFRGSLGTVGEAHKVNRGRTAPSGLQ